MALRLPTFTRLCVLALFVTAAASSILVKAKVSGLSNDEAANALDAAKTAIGTNANMPGASFPA